MKYVVVRNDETLDEIVFKNYGSSVGYLELVLQANTFLYTQDVYLQIGLTIELPEIKKEPQNRAKLWD